jgi:hypothetical protein
MGLGTAWMNANVGTFHAGVCAIAVGSCIIEAPMEAMSSAARAKTKNLVFFTLYFFS